MFFRQFQECDDVQNVTHIHARPHSHTAYSAYTYIYIVHTSGMSGVALPFRDLRQLMQNITYFASMARKMRTV